jgi:hypothetical protein
MDPNNKIIRNLKKGVLQRLQYIEIQAYYTGLVTRADVARAFGVSDAAATKDLNLYNQIAPGNLAYRHSQFGFVPTPAFTDTVSAFSTAEVLSMIANNVVTSGAPVTDTSLYGVTAEYACRRRQYWRRSFAQSKADGNWISVITRCQTARQKTGDALNLTRWYTPVFAGMFGHTTRQLSIFVILYCPGLPTPSSSMKKQNRASNMMTIGWNMHRSY